MSGKCSARCSRSTSRTKRRSSAEAKRKRASSSFWRVIGSGPRDLPAHREALEEELDGALPGVLLREQVALERRRHTAGAWPASARRAARAPTCSSRYSDSSAPSHGGPSSPSPREASVPRSCASRPDRGRSAGASGSSPASGACACRCRSRRPALSTPGRCRPATGSCWSTPAMHDQGSMAHLERALDPGRPAHRARAPDRDHARALRPLRPGAADRRARGLRGLDASRPWTAARRRPLPSARRDRPPGRRAGGAARARGGAGASTPARGQAGTLRSDRDLVEGVEVETDLGPWAVLETPGHAPSHVCLHQPERRLLISGDHLLGRVSLYFDYGFTPDPVGEFLHSLDVVETLDARLALPGHAPPVHRRPRPHPRPTARWSQRRLDRRPRRARAPARGRLRGRPRGLRRAVHRRRLGSWLLTHSCACSRTGRRAARRATTTATRERWALDS